MGIVQNIDCFPLSDLHLPIIPPQIINFQDLLRSKLSEFSLILHGKNTVESVESVNGIAVGLNFLDSLVIDIETNIRIIKMMMHHSFSNIYCY